MEHETGSPPTGSENLLLEVGEHGDCDESACMDLLGVEEPAEVDVLFVTFTKSARERLDALKRHADAPPANVGVVSVEVGGSNGGDRVGGAGGPTVRRISDPSDLTGVGIAISEFLSIWNGDGNRTVVCFESLTALLQYVDASRVFQFCNEITSKFEQAGARAHFHITPEAHERQELSVLSSLFDGRVGAAELGDGPDADVRAGGGDVDTVAAADVAPDEVCEAAPEDAGGDDPFEYAVADAADDSADATADGPGPSSGDGPEAGREAAGDAAGEDAAEAGAAGEEPPETADVDDGANDADASPDVDPAAFVSSVIAGEDDDGTDDGAAGPSLDADVRDPDEPDDDEHDDRPDATSRRAEREEMRRRLEYIGPGSSGSEGATESATGDADDAGAAAADEEAGDRSGKYAFYQRTTATVVGVVVMLVLISFMSAAMPVPVDTDAQVDGGDVTPTPTAEEFAAAGAPGDDEETATPTPEPTATPTEAATPTPTPESPTSATSSSSDSTTSSSGTSDDGSTTEETPTPTPTATPTETPTDDGNIISDTLDGDDDELL